MKSKLISWQVVCWLSASVAIGMLTLFTTDKSQAESRSNRQPEAIYITFKTTPGARITNEFGTTVPEIGLEVRWVSRSQAAPEIPVGYPAGEAISYLHGLGYQLQWLSADKVVGIK